MPKFRLHSGASELGCHPALGLTRLLTSGSVYRNLYGTDFSVGMVAM